MTLTTNANYVKLFNIFNFRHLKTIINSLNEPSRIMAVAWSPNNQRIAVATHDRVVHLFDEMGERKDKFPTKPADPKVI